MHSIWNWIVANPAEAVGLAVMLLSVVNAALPASVAAGPVGRVLHMLLDRLSLLTRSTAPGTLKWPMVRSAIVRSADPRESQSGAADVAALALVVGLAGLALVGCPHLPPVSGCAPTAQSCIEGRPHVCSASQRWEPAGDVVCRGACVVGDAGIAHCAPADGGAR